MDWLAGATVATGLLSHAGAKSANAANAKQAHLNRQFQERMSSTSHQREVKDLRAAGLNPILSASKGASTPGGAQAQMQNELEPLANSAVAASNIYNQTQLIKAQSKKLDAETQNMEFQNVWEGLKADMLKGAIDYFSDNTPAALAAGGIGAIGKTMLDKAMNRYAAAGAARRKGRSTQSNPGKPAYDKDGNLILKITGKKTNKVKK